MAGKKPTLSPIAVAAPQSRSVSDLFDGLLEHARNAATAGGTEQPAAATETEIAERFHWSLLNRLDLAPEQRDQVNALLEQAVAGDAAAEQQMRQLISEKTKQPSVSPLSR